MRREIRFGSRESELAVAQTILVMKAIARSRPELPLRLITMKTRGDLHPELPLEDAAEGWFTGKSLFTGALEKALVREEIDVCVHSLKDMAVDEDALLPIVGMAKRGDPRDMLILPRQTGKTDSPFSELCFYKPLPVEWSHIQPIGCSSMRRRIQLLARMPNLTVAAIRGNVPTRLDKLDAGQYGALILAAAGIERLGVKNRPGFFFAVRDMVPAAGQGVLALQGRRGEDYSFLDALRDPVTEKAAQTERRVMQALGGGCHFPAAAYAKISGAEMTIIALYAAAIDTPVFIEEISGESDRALEMAERLARLLLSKAEG
ncbi:MAG: hydroxymethylbilane synthase [Treponema sp.]|jgi:hydroxymethylbilane synthase|nr:hydroxymethylbilane synthase [Treponema sp.]